MTAQAATKPDEAPVEEIDVDAVERGIEASEELVLRAPNSITERRRGDFDPGQLELIRTTVAKDCNAGELAMFLEICARHQLDPFLKQIWAAKMGGRNGPVTIMVARDGLIEVANRYPDFEGIDGDIVRKNDSFLKRHSAEGVEIEHEVKSGDIKERGEVVGAWAVVHRAGRRPTYFYAPIDQYKRTSEGPWKKQLDAMILKCAESMALRKAFSVSGVVGEDEIRPQLLTARGNEAATPEIQWPEDEELAGQLRQAFEALGYTQAKIRLKVNGKTEDELTALLTELHGEADQQDPVVDAEVVE